MIVSYVNDLISIKEWSKVSQYKIIYTLNGEYDDEYDEYNVDDDVDDYVNDFDDEDDEDDDYDGDDDYSFIGEKIYNHLKKNYFLYIFFLVKK